MSGEKDHEKIPEVIPGPTESRPARACWYCGSEDIVRGLRLLGEPGRHVSIQYFTGKQLLLGPEVASEPVRVHLCNACGTIVRLYVKVTDREWVDRR
jgi:hypothetical protein